MILLDRHQQQDQEDDNNPTNTTKITEYNDGIGENHLKPSSSSSNRHNSIINTPTKTPLQRIFQHRLIGITMSACSGMAFTLSNFMVQVAHVEISHRQQQQRQQVAEESNNFTKPIQTISNVEMVLIRSAVQLCFILPFIVINKLEIFQRLKDLPYLLLMGLSGFINIIFIYSSLERIPISDTLLVTFTSPLFCALFSKLFMGEGLHWINSVAGIISFIGVTIVARPSILFGTTDTKRVTLTTIQLSNNTGDNHNYNTNNELVYLIGVLYALLGAIFLALYFALVRKLINVNGIHSAVTVFYPTLMGLIVCILLIVIGKESVYLPQNKSEVFVLSSIGVYSILALTCLTFALRVENATIVNLIRNLDVIYAFLLQYGVFGIKPNAWNLTGGAIILFATSIVVARQHFNVEKK